MVVLLEPWLSWAEDLPRRQLPDYDLVMFHRRLIRLLLVISAFAVVAMHTGMLDHSMRRMDSVDSLGPAMAQSTREGAGAISGKSPTVGRTRSHVAASQGHHSQPMPQAMSTICQLFILAAAVGVFPLVVAKFHGQRRVRVSPSSSTLLERPRRGSRRSRPPDLTMLCVAIC